MENELSTATVIANVKSPITTAYIPSLNTNKSISKKIMCIPSDIAEFLIGTFNLSIPCNIALLIVDKLKATTVKILKIIIIEVYSTFSPNKSELIGPPKTHNPIPQGKAINIENFCANITLLLTTTLSFAIYDLTNDGTIAVDSEEAIAIGIVVKSL